MGGSGSDILNGGAGRDTLTGGSGSDEFRYLDVSDSVAGSDRDRITDFNVAGGDIIDLLNIDADIGTAGDQAFTLLGSGVGFSGTAGELTQSIEGTSTFVRGDVDGDGNADIVIELKSVVTPLTDDDFNL